MPCFDIAIVARDEARTLPTLFASLEPFTRAGGVVHLVDTGSDDETAAVAREAGCVVQQVGDRFTTRLSSGDAARIDDCFAAPGEAPLVEPGQRLFHFARARDWAGTRGRCPFVLQLDASDEVLSMDLGAIDRRVDEGAAGAFGFRMRLGDHAFTAVRFYDRRWYRWVGQTHEGLYPVLAADASFIPPRTDLPPPMLSVVHHRQAKTRHYLAGLALDALDRPEMPRWQFYLGRELSYEGRYRSAVAVLAAHAARTDASNAERSQSLCCMADCLERLGDLDGALDACTRAAVLDPTWRAPLLRLAAILSARGEFAAAADAATRALAIAGPGRAAEPIAHYTWYPHALLYWSLFWDGRREHARDHWRRFAAQAPPAAIDPAHARLFA